MKYLTADLPTDLEYVDLYCVSDIHRGHRMFNERAWHTLLDNIATDRHAYMILNGDLVEAALKSSKFGDTYRTMAPGEERRVLQRELERVKDKILGITAGNHERRPARDSDECPAELIADHLGLPDRYHPVALLLEVAFGTRHNQQGRRTSFTFYVTHGAGGGRRPGAAINRMQELAWIVDGVDGYVMGHVHNLMSRVEYRFTPDPQNRTIRRRPVAYVVSGSFLDYGDYAQVGMYSPNAVSMPILRLYNKRQRDPHKRMELVLPTAIAPKMA